MSMYTYYTPSYLRRNAHTTSARMMHQYHMLVGGATVREEHAVALLTSSPNKIHAAYIARSENP